jgi:hypothetical protein
MRNSETAKITWFGPGKFRHGCDQEALKSDCFLEFYLYKLFFQRLASRKGSRNSVYILCSILVNLRKK